MTTYRDHGACERMTTDKCVQIAVVQGGSVHVSADKGNDVTRSPGIDGRIHVTAEEDGMSA